MDSMLRLWQFLLVVLTMFPAQSSRALDHCHVLFFKQNLDAFVIDSKTVYLEGLFVTAFATVSRSVLSSAGTSRLSHQPLADRQRGTHVLLAFQRVSRDGVELI